MRSGKTLWILHAMYETDVGCSGYSPSNAWPADRSWLVYTDWDLWGTKVSGSGELIDALRAGDVLETVDPPL